MRLPVVFLVILGASGILGGWSNPLKSVWNMWMVSQPPVNEKKNDCPGCAQNRIVIDHDPLLTELRVEYVKQQILKKLRLSKPPEVSMPLSTLPKPLINGNVLELRPGAPLEPEKPAESFYGKTDQVVVFPKQGKKQRIYGMVYDYLP